MGLRKDVFILERLLKKNHILYFVILCEYILNILNRFLLMKYMFISIYKAKVIIIVP